MQREQIVFVGTSDLSGHFRGKSFPAADLPSRLERGAGFAPSNIFLSAFGPIQYTAFGTSGEVFMIPDPSTRVFVPFEGSTSEFFFLGDIKTVEGAAWDFCPRHVLRRALERLHAETGLTLLSTFEQELTYSGGAEAQQPYELDGYRRQGFFGEALLAAMRQVGVVPDSFLNEYGMRQFEVTCAPATGVRGADDAVITRELAHAVAYRLGQRVSFAPIHSPDGIGNGTHIHFSFLDEQQQPVLYDAQRSMQISRMGGHFVAGILHHLPALCAIAAPAVASYYRLRPNRWAPVCADVGVMDRGAAVRVSPLSGDDESRRARQCNIEFRVADAAASPYLALAALVQAGLDGVRQQREIAGGAPRPLPGSLSEALGSLQQSTAAAQWLGPDLHAAYIAFKHAEIEGLNGLDEYEICERYARAY